MIAQPGRSNFAAFGTEATGFRVSIALRTGEGVMCDYLYILSTAGA